MAVKGAREFRSRLKAIGQVFKPVGRKWADDTVRGAQQTVAVRTGRTRRSIRVKSSTTRRAVVVATGGARFIEGGTVRHPIEPRKKRAMRWQAEGTIFAKKVDHPGQRKQPFMVPAAKDALRRNPMAEELVKLWNAAA